MILTEKIIKEFTRADEIKIIKGIIENGHSLKLMGLPKIGMSSIMRYIYRKTKEKHGLFDDKYLSFYISGRYDLDSIKQSFCEQLERLNITGVSFKNNVFDRIIREVIMMVQENFPDKRILFLLDDFHKNFKKYKENSLLDMDAIEGFRKLMDVTNVSAIVTYNAPLDTELRDDWYLNNFSGLKIDLFSAKKCRELVKTKRGPDSEITDKVFDGIYFYSGGYPFIHDVIATVSENEQKNKAEHRYQQIVGYLKERGRMLLNQENYYVDKIITVINNPNIPPENEFIEHYFRKEEVNGNKQFVVFSEYFGQWICKLGVADGKTRQKISKTNQKVKESEQGIENTTIQHLPTVIILTAIEEEYLAVRDHLDELSDRDEDDTHYETGVFCYDGRLVARVIIRECGSKNTTMAQETERVIRTFSPNYLFFVGIAGSRKPNDFAIGDVIFPEKIYSYEGGKAGKETFRARPDLVNLSYAVGEMAKKERRKDSWKELIKGDWSNDKVKAKLGTIASGEQLIEHYDSEVGRILTKHYNDTSAVEMEGFGFAKAAIRQGREKGQIQIGVVRGISDILQQEGHDEGISSHASDRRPKDVKEFASATAAAFTYWLIYKLCSNV